MDLLACACEKPRGPTPKILVFIDPYRLGGDRTRSKTFFLVAFLIIFNFLPFIVGGEVWGMNSNSGFAKPNGGSFYVATDGDDSGSGSQGQPWRTIQHAAETMEAGDTVYIRGGVYNEHVSTVRDGSANSYIVFSAYEDETPVIDGSGVGWSNGFIVSNYPLSLSCDWFEKYQVFLHEYSNSEMLRSH